MNTLQSINYPIHFNNTLSELVKFIEQGNYSRFFVLTDENTAKYCLPVIRKYIDKLDNFDVIEISAGEESKNSQESEYSEEAQERCAEGA